MQVQNNPKHATMPERMVLVRLIWFLPELMALLSDRPGGMPTPPNRFPVHAQKAVCVAFLTHPPPPLSSEQVLFGYPADKLDKLHFVIASLLDLGFRRALLFSRSRGDLTVEQIRVARKTRNS